MNNACGLFLRGTGLKTNFHITLILVLGCLLPNMAGASPPAETNILQSASDTPMIVEVQDSYFYPKAVDLFIDYETSLRQGRFDEAASTLTLIHALLVTDTKRAAFWQKVIPDIQRRTLTIIQICPDCLTGHCLTCHGQGTCPACLGKKQCPVCQGKKSFSTPCKACLCKACLASGLCPKCRGHKFIRCPTCLGSGMGKQGSGRTACPRCGGQGRTKSSLGINSMCPNCLGKGWISSTSTAQCTHCAGKGRIACPQCAGSGKCPACAGKGRTSACPQCHDTGVVTTNCEACQGTGKCLLCDNTGVCPVCKGAGICPRCNQYGFIVHYIFIVHADWVRLKTGYVLHQEYPSVANQIIEKSGSFQVFCGSREINLNIKTNEIQCVSDGELFDWVKSQALK